MVKGFGLLEILISLVLLCIGILALAKLNYDNIFLIKRSQNYSYAVILLQDNLERYAVSIPWSQIDQACSSFPKYYTVLQQKFYVNCYKIDSSQLLKQIIFSIYWGKHKILFSVYRCYGDS